MTGLPPLSEQQRTGLEETCRRVRALTLREIGSLGSGHVGGSLSMIEAMVAIYARHLRQDPGRPDEIGRDRFVLSKGHSGPGYYATLAHFGYFDPEELLTLNRPGTRLPSHPDMSRTPGVDMTTGSLGQGLSAATGIAEAQRRMGTGARTYVIVGDGESQEGQVWEAAMWAAQLRLDNLIALTDYNDMCLDGYVHDINDLAPLDEKWRAFRWFVQSVDGHDIAAIDAALTTAERGTGRPAMIIMRTRKGHGVSFLEELGVATHSMALSPGQVAAGLAELGGEEDPHA